MIKFLQHILSWWRSPQPTRYYFLIYRHPMDAGPCWKEPTGGLVMDCDDVECLVDVGTQRYHIGPHEGLSFVRALDTEWQDRAARLHEQWEHEMAEWTQDHYRGDDNERR
jgi:hypothetical protein